MLNEYGRIGNARSRSRRIIASSLLILLFVLAVVAVSASSQTARPRTGDVPADGEQWVTDSSRHILVPSEGLMSLTKAEIDSISKSCPGVTPAVYCNPRDMEVLVPDAVRKMVETQ